MSRSPPESAGALLLGPSRRPSIYGAASRFVALVRGLEFDATPGATRNASAQRHATFGSEDLA